ncbi:Nucleolar pre-ribosomal-associated protein 1 [Quillaja saponaria]|uniref:Nucleolar pre-ribosomal-associated protein 1 n=1 Tax=Quillaja saponaria TaxID=32244 RepID=A0AAD7LMM7_QUISA|nr:Nucleolar pre-ribosomal-associated protein 1 [Quillaja saponaria]
MMMEAWMLKRERSQTPEIQVTQEAKVNCFINMCGVLLSALNYWPLGNFDKIVCWLCNVILRGREAGIAKVDYTVEGNVSGVLRGLGHDDDETIIVLSTLHDKVLVEQSLVPPGLLSVLFGSVTLEQLIDICGRGNGGHAAELEHSVLIKSWLLLMADPPWFASIYLAANLISSVGTGLSFGFLNSHSYDQPSFDSADTQSIMKCLFPRQFSWSMIYKGLLHSDFLVKHGGHSKTHEPSLKRTADIENYDENRSDNINIKQLKIIFVDGDIDIVVGGISSAEDAHLTGDNGQVVDTLITDELDNAKDLRNDLAEIWGLDQCSMLVTTLEDVGIYFHSKLIDVLKFYLVVKKAVKLRKTASYLVKHCASYSWLSSLILSSGRRLNEDEKGFS